MLGWVLTIVSQQMKPSVALASERGRVWSGVVRPIRRHWLESWLDQSEGRSAKHYVEERETKAISARYYCTGYVAII